MKKESGHVIPIISALVVAIAPHTPGLPLWINAWCLFMWGYMLVGLKRRWPLPNTLFRYLLAFIGIAGLLLTYSVGIGGDAFVGLLALMAAIKPFEMATHRHQMIAILLTYFIIITSLFRSESMFIVIYMFFSVFVTTVALIRINDLGARFRDSLNLAGRILAQAIPLMVLLFLLFPRLPGSLFGIEDKTLGRTGFSDRMSPGSVSSLSQDQSPAFRVKFDGPTPLTQMLYWRGIVFQTFDGKTWTVQDLPPLNPPSFPAPGNSYSYTILLEPHNNPWLMGLDRPVSGPPWAQLTPGQVLKSRRPVNQKIRYAATSLVRDEALIGIGQRDPLPRGQNPSPLPTGSVLSEKRAGAIILSAKNKNPRARKLAGTMAGLATTPAQKAQVLLAYFRENQFVYTLNPPIAGGHPIDDFLFEHKKGYCEHYASAFAFMMNVMDVPARVVGGYLGGEHNPYGNYITIRQSYAHAWVEILDGKNGWVRVDPTLAVAPGRLGTNPDGSSASVRPSIGTFSFFRKLKFGLEAVNLRWEAWFTGYSYFEQKAFLEKIGLGKWGGFAGSQLILALVTLVSLAGFSGILFWLLYRKKVGFDPVQHAYSLFCSCLGKNGMTRQSDQGPIDFANVCVKKRPDLKQDIIAITDFYVQLRFQRQFPATTLAAFQRRIKKFNPKRSSRKDSSH
jgi:protein-glutamine gamma-glutamyltransferase